jgi:hypothetical protein
MRPKIFVIGFNKTASFSLHKLFQSNSLRSVHDDKWLLNNYDCFTDNEVNGMFNFETYYNKFPDSIFILNTRSLDSWLLSRLKHGFIHKQAWAWPPAVNTIKYWINKRDKHYTAVLDFFKDKPNNLIIVNIEKPFWLNFLGEQLNLSISTSKPDNVTRKIKDINILTLIDDNITNAFKELDYIDAQKSSCFSNTQLELVKLYKNNIF